MVPDPMTGRDGLTCDPDSGLMRAGGVGHPAGRNRVHTSRLTWCRCTRLNQVGPTPCPERDRPNIWVKRPVYAGSNPDRSTPAGIFTLPRVKHRRMATEDYDEAAERVKRQAAEQKQAFEEQHDALLDAAAADEELTVEETDTAHIGDATLTVTTDIPGKVIRKLDDIHDADAPPGQMLDVYVDVLTAQTLSIEANGYTWANEGAIRTFFTDFIDDHDAESAAVLCLERVIEEPVGLEQERRADIAQSFPAKGRRRGHGARPDGNRR